MKTALCIIAVALCAGCTSTTYREGTVKFSRVSFMTKQVIADLKVTTKGSDKEITLKGYQNDAVSAAAAITAAAVEAAGKALKP